jgi:hypothetical protein
MRTITSASQSATPTEPARLDVTMTVSGLTKSREGP